MKQYKLLNQEQRYQISGLLKAGLKQTKIAAGLGVNKGTISRELKRNAGKRGWRPEQVQALRDERRQSCINGKWFSRCFPEFGHTLPFWDKINSRFTR